MPPLRHSSRPFSNGRRSYSARVRFLPMNTHELAIVYDIGWIMVLDGRRLNRWRMDGQMYCRLRLGTTLDEWMDGCRWARVNDDGING